MHNRNDEDHFGIDSVNYKILEAFKPDDAPIAVSRSVSRGIITEMIYGLFKIDDEKFAIPLPGLFLQS
jgi:hypothetical protein